MRTEAVKAFLFFGMATKTFFDGGLKIVIGVAEAYSAEIGKG